MPHHTKPYDQIESSSFKVSGSKPLCYEALLGTCVGVVIYDTNAGVGGLYHILLPEPTNPGHPWGAETYASTGMPVFLEALYRAGARPENMKAVIAGGALVGPISIEDLNMDIGGRTTEIVRSILKASKIEVDRSETGGFFSCKLILDLEDFSCSIEPIGQRVGKIKTKSAKISSDKLDALVAHVRPIPQVAMKVIRMINAHSYSMTELASEVRQDQIIGAKVINISNSAYFSPKREIESIDQALVMLGERMMMQLVLSSSLELFFHDSDQGYSLCKGGLYHHALSTALVAEKLAWYTEHGLSDVAYTAGLLHDIGKVVLDQNVSDIFPLFYRRILEEESKLTDVEKESLGVSHTEAGLRLAELWNLPENLQEVIAYHHQPEKAKKHSTLVHLIYLADLLVSRFHVGRDLDRIGTGKLEQRLQHLGLSLEKFPEIVDQIPWKALAESLHIK